MTATIWTWCSRPWRALALPLLLSLLAECAIDRLGNATSNSAMLHLLQWNPHWQCFVWNQNNCTLEVQRHLFSILESSDIDFANLVEFEPSDFDWPKPWQAVENKYCGMDVVHLVYNSTRWSARLNSVKGCIARRDRPFIVQEFEDVDDGRRVVVVGAHFPHPVAVNGTMAPSVFKRLKQSIAQVIAFSNHHRVVVLADTNEPTAVSSESIMKHLGLSSGVVQSSKLEQTCCFNDGFPKWGAFDRAMANFGHDMNTTVFFDDPFPEWAEQVLFDNITNHVTEKAAFHKAIQVSLSTSAQDWADPPSRSRARRPAPAKGLTLWLFRGEEARGQDLWANRLHIVAIVGLASVTSAGLAVSILWLRTRSEEGDELRFDSREEADLFLPDTP